MSRPSRRFRSDLPGVLSVQNKSSFILLQNTDLVAKTFLNLGDHYPSKVDPGTIVRVLPGETKFCQRHDEYLR